MSGAAFFIFLVVVGCAAVWYLESDAVALRRQLAESRKGAQDLAARVAELDGLCQRQQAQAIDLQRLVDECKRNHTINAYRPDAQKKRRARK